MRLAKALEITIDQIMGRRAVADKASQIKNKRLFKKLKELDELPEKDQNENDWENAVQRATEICRCHYYSTSREKEIDGMLSKCFEGLPKKRKKMFADTTE